MVRPPHVLRPARSYRPGALDGFSPQSRQELHNNYTITNSPALDQLQKFFRAAVRDLTSAYENRAAARVEVDPQPSICDQMRRDITHNSQENTDPTDLDPTSDIPVVESLSPLIISSATPLPLKSGVSFCNICCISLAT